MPSPVATINPAIAHGISQHVGSIEGGKLADLVVYEPAYFGVKPFLVLKGGLLVMAQMGDPNASIATPQPVYMRPQVHDPETLESWTSRWLRLSLGPLEGVLVVSAARAGHAGGRSEIQSLNLLAAASIMPPSIRTASREMGEQLVALGTTWGWCAAGLSNFLPVETEAAGGCWHHAVAFGLLGAIAGAAPEAVLTA